MRYLTSDAFNQAHVCCIFDCCRTPLDKMKGLMTDKGVGDTEKFNDSE